MFKLIGHLANVPGTVIIPLPGEQWTKKELHFPPDTKPHLMAKRLSKGQT